MIRWEPPVFEVRGEVTLVRLALTRVSYTIAINYVSFRTKLFLTFLYLKFHFATVKLIKVKADTDLFYTCTNLLSFEVVCQDKLDYTLCGYSWIHQRNELEL